MYGIDILVKEHEAIKRMAAVMRKASLSILTGKELVVKDFYDMADFIRNYADKHHHGKEEKILFVYMKQEFGKIAENLITHGMLVEHDFGRLYIGDMLDALRNYEENPNEGAKLDIITNATAYTYLIQRHIDKENEVIFTYGEKNLSKESAAFVDEQSKTMEEEANKVGTQERYMTMLERLEQAYM